MRTTQDHFLWPDDRKDEEFESRGIVPVIPHRETVSADVCRLFFAWLGAVNIIFDGGPGGALPWVPLGCVGPVLVVGHCDPDTPCPLPEWAAQRVVIPDKFHRAIFQHVRGAYQRRKPWDGSVPLSHNFPQTRPELTTIKQAIEYMADHMFVANSDRAQVLRNLEKATPTSSTGYPDGFAEAALFLLGAASVIDIRNVRFDDEITKAIHEPTRAQLNIAPIFSTESFYYIASPKVPNHAAFDTLNATLNTGEGHRKVRLVLASAYQLRETAANRAASQQNALNRNTEDSSPPTETVAVSGDQIDIVINEAEMRSLKTPTPGEISNAAYLNFVIWTAISRGASDIHFEQVNGKGRIRIRRHGRLSQLGGDIPYEVSRGLVGVVRSGKIKGLTTDNFSAQDARGTVRIGNERYSLRVNLIPHLRDTHQVMVMRILEKRSKLMDLEKMGFPPTVLAAIRRAMYRPSGLIFVTGPTGSGKTTTLHAILKELNRPDVKINTIEDPVEIELDGATQSMPDEDKGVGFPELVPALMRQDPDILMIGEVRDQVTAGTSLTLSETGHLVFGTLHTDSEESAASRMADLLQDKTRIAVMAKQTILIIAQRLVDRLCPDCREEVDTTPEEQAILTRHRCPNVKRVFRAHTEGCSADGCDKGYVGRTCIASVLPITKKIQSVIMKGGDPNDIREAADAAGFYGLFDQALPKVIKGEISMSEAEQWRDPWEDFEIIPDPTAPAINGTTR